MAWMPKVYFYDMDRPIHQMERDFFRPERFFDCIPVPLPHWPTRPQPQQLRRNWDNGYRPLENSIKFFDELSTAMSQMGLNEVGSNIIADEEKFQVNVDVQHFAPGEINVSVVDGQVIIEGKHEEKRDEHGFVSRHFVRKYALPQGCLPDTVQSKLSSDGVLTVIAPKVLAMPSPGERIIPITHTGPIQKKQIGSPEINDSEKK